MAPYPHEIDVVRQAREKTMARGSGRHFEQRNARVANPPAKHIDMTVQRRDAGVLNGLAGREQPLHLIEDVIPEPNDRAVSPVDPKTGDAGGRCHARNRRAVLYTCQEIAVDREKSALPLHARASMARILSDAVSNVRSLGAGPVDDKQSRLQLREIVLRGQNDVVGSTGHVEFPRCLEELEELFNGRDLTWF